MSRLTDRSNTFSCRTKRKRCRDDLDSGHANLVRYTVW